MKRFLKINAADNVAVALADDLHEGETLDVEGVAVTLREDVARGHKFALRDIAAGENVVKYGYPIGHARNFLPRISFTKAMSMLCGFICPTQAKIPFSIQ